MGAGLLGASRPRTARPRVTATANTVVCLSIVISFTSKSRTSSLTRTTHSILAID